MEAMVKSRSNVRTAAIATTKVVAIAISFAALYVLMVTYSPVPAKSSWMGVMFGKTLRLANGLRAFMLVSVAALFGVSMGNAYLNVGDGLIGLWKPVATLLLGLAAVGVSKVWGRSTAKDLTVLAVYGVIWGGLQSLIGAMLLMGVNGGEWTPAITSIVSYRLITEPLLICAGYPFVRLFENLMERKRNGQGSPAQ